LSFDICTLIIDITTFTDGDIDIITIQKVPPHIYDASYPAWVFNKKKLFTFFNMNGYEKMEEWNMPYSLKMRYHGGTIFNRKNKSSQQI
jgi:hypothetical protein